MMGRKPTIDRELLWKFLQDGTDRYNRITINKKKLAEELDIHRVTLVRIFRQYADDERLKVVKIGHGGQATYELNPPERWKSHTQDKSDL